ncbi:uncharacterized protein LOC131943801 isoform X2 [Physella acuta]|uniref:uncharacterized protein LOC131943801 isoform X2 n=1 Tax=Physella acuta TaxID=109671 RepID=UPI0027DDC3FB|nr:uncharacterized protein LOC131943801 isoform X2 [Physella acuta]
MEVDIIIKFGGSAITDKNIFETIKSHELSIAAQCIKTCTDHGLKCIVVHGAGSFGHHQAKQYEVNTGLTDLKTKEDSSLKVRGYCLTRQSVTKLNQMVVDSLLQSGVPAVACSPGSSWITSNREPLHSPCEVIAGFVNTGLVPVLHGDCSLDDKLGCCILSGDTVIKMLLVYMTDHQINQVLC